MHSIVLILLLSLSLGQVQSFAQQLADGFEEVETGAIDGVIVPKDRAPYFYSNNKTQGYFTPLKEDVLRAEARVIDYIEDHTPQALGYPRVPDLDKNLSNYKRQYVGVVLDGKKKIWLNFFCHPGNFTWKHDPLNVLGGGGCYFNLLYDIDSETFSHLLVNGVVVRQIGGSKLPDEKPHKREDRHKR